MKSDFSQEWTSVAKHLEAMPVKYEAQHWMYATLTQFCRAIAATPYATIFQVEEHALSCGGAQHAIFLWKRDGSAPNKGVRVCVNYRYKLEYGEALPNLYVAKNFVYANPTNMIPKFTQFLTGVNWSGFGLEE